MEPIKDRIDVLIEEAREGDPDSQLKLAKWFAGGRLVEVSKENALYWAFKAADSGRLGADSFYNELLKTDKPQHALIKTRLSGIMLFFEILPILEIIICGILWIVLPHGNLCKIFGKIALMGVATGVGALIIKGWYANESKGKDTRIAGGVSVLILSLIYILLFLI